MSRVSFHVRVVYGQGSFHARVVYGQRHVMPGWSVDSVHFMPEWSLVSGQSLFYARFVYRQFCCFRVVSNFNILKTLTRFSAWCSGLFRVLKSFNMPVPKRRQKGFQILHFHGSCSNDIRAVKGLNH